MNRVRYAIQRWLNIGENVVVDEEGPDRNIEIERLKTPWPTDTVVELNSYQAEPDGRWNHYVYCFANGPNRDGTVHHARIGLWMGFTTEIEMNIFAATLIQKIRYHVGVTPLLLKSREDRNNHARWCIGEAESPPRGEDVDAFVLQYYILAKLAGGRPGE